MSMGRKRLKEREKTDPANGEGSIFTLVFQEYLQ